MAVQENRPFFSIVISCYNSRDTLGPLLQSLVDQELSQEELEIIISDDHSTDSYEDIVEQFQDVLNIKRTQTEYNCCPGNTREAGAQVATGTWLCFSDHDDKFVPGALQYLKTFLKTNKERYYICTSFYEVNENEELIQNIIASKSGGWTHGKFYNLDNLWKTYNVHYKKDLKSHEDVYLTSVINCILDQIHTRGENAGTYIDDLFTYMWFNRPNSESHKRQEDNINFLEKRFIDYIQATGYVYLNYYKEGALPYKRAKQFLLDSILLCYFYSESFFFYNPTSYVKENFVFLGNYVNYIKETFNLTNENIIQYAAADRAFAYNEALQSSNIGTGGLIPNHTLLEWLYSLDSGFFKSPEISCFYIK